MSVAHHPLLDDGPSWDELAERVGCELRLLSPGEEALDIHVTMNLYWPCLHAYPLMWRVKVIRPEWHGRRCRIVVHGGQRGARLIEFENGERVICPGQYLRKAKRQVTES